MSRNLEVFEGPEELATALATKLQNAAREAVDARRQLSLMLSGGSTPQKLYRLLAEEPYRTGIPWSHIHLFWGDERCVPPNHPESNYGVACDELISQIVIPAGNVHRIRGEADPDTEATRYAEKLVDTLPGDVDAIPVCDWVLLGLGTDGHTASLFPNDWSIAQPGAVCRTATHPSTGQRRVTVALNLINSARRVSFLVTGQEKAHMLRTIFTTPTSEQTLPAGLVRPVNGQLEWLCDRAAASLC